MRIKRFRLTVVLFVIAVSAVLITDLYARAGGAGGRSSSGSKSSSSSSKSSSSSSRSSGSYKSSSSYSGSHSGSSYSGYSSSGVYSGTQNSGSGSGTVQGGGSGGESSSGSSAAGIIIMILIVGGIVFAVFYFKRKSDRQSIFNLLPTGVPVDKVDGYDSFIVNNPDFDENRFKENVKTAFLSIQEAWQNQDLSKVRKYLSDGVYQRFNTQFKMMKLLQQTNTIENVEVRGIYIDKIENDGLYDIIHTAIHAKIKDYFMNKLDPSMNSGGEEEFVEYWSFLKKRGKQTKDIYNTDACPNCGSPLPADMGEVCKCESCGTLTNSGEYDWVLSEITQADDYVGANPKLGKSWELNAKVRKLIDENEDFSVQLVEDKASNGYLQILTAIACNDPSVMRRFVSDNVFNRLGIKTGGEVTAYNRIFLNDVFLVGVSGDGDRNVLHIAVKSSYQRIVIENSHIRKIDEAVVSRTEVIFMTRDKNAVKSKGSLYAHCCPNCGAPVENSLNVNCSYCGSVMNSTGSEWIITEIFSLDDYNEWLGSHKGEVSYSMDTDLIDKLFDVRDFALNNVMMVMAADGVFAASERDFAEKLAKKWGYDVESLQSFFNMAQNGQLVLRMPDDRKKQVKIFKLMKKAAEADRNISGEEQRLLDYIVSEYGLQDAV